MNLKSRRAGCHWLCRIVLLPVVLLPVAGCGKPDSFDQLRRAALQSNSSEGAFASIAETLNTLERGIEPDVRPWQQILDRSLSIDEEPVLAVLADDPEADGDQFNLLVVVSENADFVQLGVRPGDFVNFVFKESISASDNQGLTKQGTREFRVVQVVDQNKLRVSPGLTGELITPLPIVIRRVSTRRAEAIERRLIAYRQRGKPPTGWEPTPDEDALHLLVGQLNQWIALQQAAGCWKLDPMVAALGPKERRAFGFDQLDLLPFRNSDGRLLQEAIWLRDIARQAQGNSGLEQFTALFDWVVRNLQLETDDSLSHIAQRPWQALISGRATASTRAWVAILAARQLHLDTVMLALPNKKNSAGDLRPWAIGLWQDDDLHLFDPALGLSIGRLSALRGDGQLLRKLDLDDQHRYPVEAAELSDVVALIEATPLYLSRRARLVESQLAGRQRVVLTASASKLAARLKPLVSDVRLWKLARETLSRQAHTSAAGREMLVKQYDAFTLIPRLWKGRVLQFKNDDHRTEEDENQKLVRVYDRSLDARVHFARCRYSEREMDPARFSRRALDAMRISKQNATYWMGQIAFSDGDYPVANDYFQARTLEAFPKGPWTHGARYNLARGHERLAEFYQRLLREGSGAEIPEVLEDLIADPDHLDKALLRQRQIEHLQQARRLYEEEDDDSPQRHGNLLRARRLVIPGGLP